MLHKITLILFAALLTTVQLLAQQTITVNASNNDISDHLDLEAVAYLFGEAKDLEMFEEMLNDPERQVSNLDLNRDGYIDYLRVIESYETGIYVVVIQAVLGEDLFQDVATIDVDIRDKQNARVYIVGNEYIYGANYIIEPVFVSSPLIYDYFWYPHHTVWCSPYYWSYYPRYYHYRKPHRLTVYHRHVNNYYHHLDCRYTPYHRIEVATRIHKKIQRNDYQEKHPEQAFNRRNSDVENRRELVNRRSASPNTSVRQANTAIESKSRNVATETRSTPERRSSGNRSTSVSISQPVQKSVSAEPTRRSTESNNSNSIRSISKSQSSSSFGNSGSNSSSSRRSEPVESRSQKSAPTVTSMPSQSNSGFSRPSSGSSNSNTNRSSVSSTPARSSSNSSSSRSAVSSSSNSSSTPASSRSVSKPTASPSSSSSSKSASVSSSKPSSNSSSSSSSSSRSSSSSSSRSSSKPSSSSSNSSPGRR